MRWHLDRKERMLSMLLRASLQGDFLDLKVFEEVSHEDWRECYKLAITHGVMALAWEGVCMLPEQLQPQKGLKVKWALGVEDYEKRYLYYCHTVEKLVEFYKGYGIASVQLKGVGFSTHYKHPNHREGGDIDIFTFSADKRVLADEDANKLADSLMVEHGIEVDTSHPKHSCFYFEEIPIENHKQFINVTKRTRHTEEVLHALLNPQEVELPTGYKLPVPSEAFNQLFIAHHAMQHFGAGLAMHHVYDWACLLKKGTLNIPEEITDHCFTRFMYALTLVSNELLGTEVEVPHTDEVEVLASDIANYLRRFDGRRLPKSKWGIIRYKWKQITYRYQAQHSLSGASVWQVFGGSAWFHLCHPHIIFK